ncbi:hypothetical protein [Roseobacter sp.]|uniref:hypothetical protein n=1 Tax=Roseobacter sp. TaxID=1907202 RepID=UPI0025E497C5|nr:hypothetical protein [Roseobacter sp.]
MLTPSGNSVDGMSSVPGSDTPALPLLVGVSKSTQPGIVCASEIVIASREVAN